MAAQQQKSNLARFATQLVQANEKHKDTPVDLGNQRLPAGINDGVARLNKAYFGIKQTGNDKGKDFFRATAVVLSPKDHNGKKVAGRTTSLMINIYDEPARGKREAQSIQDNWGVFLNFIKSMGITPTAEKDFGKMFAYYVACLQQLEKVKPTIGFSTRGWTPTATKEKPNPEEMIFEDWHGLVDYHEQGDPVADGMGAPSTEDHHVNGTGTELTAAPFQEPPQEDHNPPADEAAPEYGDAPVDPADEVTMLAELAGSTPEGEADSDEVTAAKKQLAEMAIAAGATEAMVSNAESWSDVAAMALGQLPESTAPAVGATAKFRKRDSKGEPLKNKANQPFAATEIIIVTVDEAASTVTAKTKDGKPVVGLDKKPIQIKWEWLE